MDNSDTPTRRHTPIRPYALNLSWSEKNRSIFLVCECVCARVGRGAKRGASTLFSLGNGLGFWRQRGRIGYGLIQD